MQRLVRRDLLRGERQPVFLQPLPVRRHLHCGQRRLRLPVQRTVLWSEVCRFAQTPSLTGAVALPVSSWVRAVSTFTCSCRCRKNTGFLCLFFPCPSGASSAPTARMNLVKTVERVLTVWMVLSVSVTQVLKNKLPLNGVNYLFKGKLVGPCPLQTWPALFCLPTEFWRRL